MAGTRFSVQKTSRSSLHRFDKMYDIISDKLDFTPCDVIRNLAIGDTSFQFYGYIEKIRRLSDNGKTKSFAFTLNNGQGSTIQFVAFNELAVKFQKLVNQSGLVVLVDKVRPKPPKNPAFCRTTCQLELHAQTSTVVTIEGIYKPDAEVENTTINKYAELRNIRESVGQKVELTAYIKSEFRVVTTQAGGQFLSGSLTDLEHKLQVTVQMGCKDDVFLSGNSNRKGMKVVVYGSLVNGPNDLLKLNVASTMNIVEKIVDDLEEDAPQPFLRTINGFRLIP